MPAAQKLKQMLFTCVFAAALIASPALAAEHLHQGEFRLTLENAYNKKIYAVVVFYNTYAEGWVSMGWYDIAPGGKKTAYLRGACPGMIQVYAQCPDGTKWQGKDPKNTVSVNQKVDYWYLLNDQSTLQPKPDDRVIAMPVNIKHNSSEHRFTFRP